MFCKSIFVDLVVTVTGFVGMGALLNKCLRACMEMQG